MELRLFLQVVREMVRYHNMLTETHRAIIILNAVINPCDGSTCEELCLLSTNSLGYKCVSGESTYTFQGKLS